MAKAESIEDLKEGLMEYADELCQQGMSAYSAVGQHLQDFASDLSQYGSVEEARRVVGAELDALIEAVTEARKRVETL